MLTQYKPHSCFLSLSLSASNKSVSCSDVTSWYVARYRSGGSGGTESSQSPCLQCTWTELWPATDHWSWPRPLVVRSKYSAAARVRGWMGRSSWGGQCHASRHVCLVTSWGSADGPVTCSLRSSLASPSLWHNGRPITFSAGGRFPSSDVSWP